MDLPTTSKDAAKVIAELDSHGWMEMPEKEWKVFVGRLVDSVENGDQLFRSVPMWLSPQVFARLWSTLIEHICLGRVEAVSPIATERPSYKVSTYLGLKIADDPQLLCGALALVLQRIGESARRGATYDELFQRVAAAVDFGREIRRRGIEPPPVELCEVLFAVLGIAERSVDSRAYRLLFRFAQFLAQLYPFDVPFAGFGISDGNESEIRQLFDETVAYGQVSNLVEPSVTSANEGDSDPAANSINAPSDSKIEPLPSDHSIRSTSEPQTCEVDEDDDDSPLEYDATELRDACRRRQPTTVAAYIAAFRDRKSESADELVAAFAAFPKFASQHRRAVAEQSAQLVGALLHCPNRFNLKGFGENVGHCLVNTLRYDLAGFFQFADRLLDSQTSSSRRLHLLKVCNDLIVALNSVEEYSQPNCKIKQQKPEKSIGRILRQSVGLTRAQPKPVAKATVNLVDLVIRPLIRVAMRMEWGKELDTLTMAGVLSVLSEAMSHQLSGYNRIADEQLALLNKWRTNDKATADSITQIALEHCSNKLQQILAPYRSIEELIDEESEQT